MHARKRTVERTVQPTPVAPTFLTENDSHLIGTMILTLKGWHALQSMPSASKLDHFRLKGRTMTETRIGYARCSTDKQDLAAQRAALVDLGVSEDRIYTDHGLTGTKHERPGLAQALAAVREGDTFVVSKLDRLARSVPDARAIADELESRGVKLALGGSIYDPANPMGKMFFNILATFAEFEADLIRMRTREGMAIARAKGKLKGKKPKLSDRRQTELRRMYDTGDYSISDLAEVFDVSRPTVYRVLQRTQSING